MWQERKDLRLEEAQDTWTDRSGPCQDKLRFTSQHSTHVRSKSSSRLLNSSASAGAFPPLLLTSESVAGSGLVCCCWSEGVTEATVPNDTDLNFFDGVGTCHHNVRCSSPRASLGRNGGGEPSRALEVTPVGFSHLAPLLGASSPSGLALPSLPSSKCWKIHVML